MEYQNILIFCLRKIGDAAIATAGISMLRRAYPAAKITVLARPLVREIFENSPIVDHVIAYDYTHQAKYSEIHALAKKLASRRFDLSVVLDGKARSALIAWLAGIPKRAGFERIEFRNFYLKLFYTDLFQIDYPAESIQQVKNHEIFINRLTGKNAAAQCVLPPCAEDAKTKIDALLAQSPDGALLIGLCIRSGQRIKDWPLERFAAVCDALYAEHPEAAFYAIGSPADTAAVADLRQKTAAPIVSLCGQTSLIGLSYLLSRLDFFLTVDTGSAHIAAASGDTPMVVIFGGTSEKKWKPYGSYVQTLSASGLGCRPCSSDKAKCASLSPDCLQAVTAEMAIEACRRQLRRSQKDQSKQ